RFRRSRPNSSIAPHYHRWAPVKRPRDRQPAPLPMRSRLRPAFAFAIYRSRQKGSGTRPRIDVKSPAEGQTGAGDATVRFSDATVTSVPTATKIAPAYSGAPTHQLSGPWPVIAANDSANAAGAANPAKFATLRSAPDKRPRSDGPTIRFKIANR